MSLAIENSTESTQRIYVIDALRGFALLGIVVAHMTEQYYSGVSPEKHGNETTVYILDKITQGVVSILITGKFYMIFSFLFGLSFYIQLSKAKADFAFLMKFSWRLILLSIIGFIHHLHYRGDILTIYAMLGFVLLLTYRLPDAYLLAISILLILDVPGMITRIINFLTHDTSMNNFIHPDQNELLRYYETFKSGAYLDLLSENLRSFRTKMVFQVWSGRLYITMGLFFLGYYAGKKKFFEDLPARISVLKKYIRYALWSFLGCVLFALAFFAIGEGVMGGLSQDTRIAAGLSFLDILNACLALIYVAWFIVLFQRDNWRSRLMVFYEAGRMGLTTYLTQAMFGLLIYSTLGLGLLGELGASISFLLAIIIFVTQIWIAKQWFKRFNYGPVEWAWRSLTTFRLQPLLKKS